MAIDTREIHLARRPHGLPQDEDFAVVTRQLPDLEPGQVLVRNDYLSVDPYMRPRMNDVKSYIPPFELGKALDGGAIGTVIESADEDIAVGTVVSHGLGWREHAVLRSKWVRVIDDESVPASYHLGVLGMPGMTAFVGLFDIAAFKPGDAVFVSGAAGAVGGLVGQFAKLAGASRVIGSAGSAEKVAFLQEEFGFDAALNYRDGDLVDQLAAAAPEGFDVYFDNVGGDHLAAALETINDHGRMALCGTVSSYNATGSQTVPGNMFRAVGKRLTMRGFIVSDHEQRRAEFEQQVTAWLQAGELTYRETFIDGLDQMIEGFRGLLTGANTGKMVVRL